MISFHSSASHSSNTSSYKSLSYNSPYSPATAAALCCHHIKPVYFTLHTWTQSHQAPEDRNPGKPADTSDTENKLVNFKFIIKDIYMGASGEKSWLEEIKHYQLPNILPALGMLL